MTRAGTTPTAAMLKSPEIESAIEMLEGVLGRMQREHEALLRLCGEHRRAIASSDAGSIQRSVSNQNQVVQRIAGLEKERVSLVEQIARRVEKSPPASPTLQWLRDRVAEPLRQRIEAAAAPLRDVMRLITREQEVIKEASIAIAAHLDGVMRQVSHRLSHTGTYGRAGYVEHGATIVSALDMSL